MFPRFQKNWYPPYLLATSEMLVWRKGNIEKTVSLLQYCIPL